MTITTAHKRLDELESSLTPKEWAIRLASEIRKHPSALAFTRALAKLPLHELPVRRPYFAFEAQAGDRHPGRKPDDIRSRHQLTDALWEEFHTLKLLICQVNQAMQHNVERVSSQAALRMSSLHSIILRGAFSRAASQAAAVLQKQKPGVAKPERQAVLKGLAAFTEVDIRETLSDQDTPRAPDSCYLTPLGAWIHGVSGLLEDFFARRTAVELIQVEHFNGHPILFLDLEGELVEVERTFENAVATANEYLNHRAGMNEGKDKNNLTIDLKSIKASANGRRAAATAEKWLQDARFEAIESDAEQWERWRETCRVE